MVPESLHTLLVNLIQRLQNKLNEASMKRSNQSSAVTDIVPVKSLRINL